MNKLKILLLLSMSLMCVNAFGLIKVEIDKEKEVCDLSNKDYSEICLVQNKVEMNLSFQKLEVPDNISQFPDQKQKKIQSQIKEQNRLRDRMFNNIEHFVKSEAYKNTLWILFFLLMFKIAYTHFAGQKQDNDLAQIKAWLYQAFGISILFFVQSDDNFDQVRAIADTYSEKFSAFQQSVFSRTIEKMSGVDKIKEVQSDEELTQDDTKAEFKTKYNDTSIATQLFEIAIAQNRNVRRELMLSGEAFPDSETLKSSLQALSTTDLKTTFGDINGSLYTSQLDFGFNSKYGSITFTPYLVNETSLVEMLELDSFLQSVRRGDSFLQAAGDTIDSMLEAFTVDGAIDDNSRRMVDRMLTALADIYRNESDVDTIEAIFDNKELETAVNLAIDNHCLDTMGAGSALRFVEDLSLDSSGSLDCVGVLNDELIVLGKVNNDIVKIDTLQSDIEKKKELNLADINSEIDRISKIFSTKRTEFENDYITLHAKVYNVEKRVAIMREKGVLSLGEYTISTFLQNSKDYTVELSSPRKLNFNFNRYYLTNLDNTVNKTDAKDSDMMGLLNRDYVRDILNETYRENRDNVSIYDIQQRSQFSNSTLYNSTNLDETKDTLVNELQQLSQNLSVMITNDSSTDRNGFQAFSDSVDYVNGRTKELVNITSKTLIYTLLAETVLKNNRNDTNITQKSKSVIYKTANSASNVIGIANEGMLVIVAYGSAMIIALEVIDFIINHGLIVVGMFFSLAMHISVILAFIHLFVIVPLQSVSNYGTEKLHQNMKNTFMTLIAPFVIMISYVIIASMTPTMINGLFTIYAETMKIFNYLLSSVEAFQMIVSVISFTILICTYPFFLIVVATKTYEILIDIFTKIHSEDDFYDKVFSDLTTMHSNMTGVLQSNLVSKVNLTKDIHKKLRTARNDTLSAKSRLQTKFR